MKAPAFLFYAGDFLSSPDVQSMDTREVGAYVLLLLNAWQGDTPGHLLNNEDRIRRITRMTVAEWEVSRDLLLGKFPVADMGLTRYNPRMVAEAEKQETNRLKKAENGKRGGRPKKQNESENNLQLSKEKHMLSKPKANDKQTESLSISISTPTNVGGGGATTDLPALKAEKAKREQALAAHIDPDDLQGVAESPLVKPAAFAAILQATGYPNLDAERYALQIAAKSEGVRRTASQWRSRIIEFVNNDYNAGKLLTYPVQTPNEIPSNWDVTRQGPYVLAPVSLGIPNISSMLKPEYQIK